MGISPEEGGSKVPAWRVVSDQGCISQAVIDHHYEGSGTEDKPYQVTWMEADERDPMNYSELKKWLITILSGVLTLAVALVSSAYSGSINEIILRFRVSEEVAILGISLFVVGFAVGPLFWGPLSELYGRRYTLIASALGLAIFTAGAAGSQNIWTLIILRFFAATLGSAPFAVSGGVITDIFPMISRGLASGLYCIAPFLGPTLGPIIGGFISENAGWRWVEGVVAIFAGALAILTFFTLPETCAPVLLRKRAARLSAHTGQVYRSKLEIEQGKKSPAAVLKVALSRPWLLLFREPIVLLLSIYLSIIYGVYKKKVLSTTGRIPPEARLPDSFWGAIALPVGLFWFAWTNYPSIHWMASIAAGVPFGFGMVMVFLPVLNYLIDAYTIYAASVLAANAALRSMFGAAFPLFTTPMYNNLGIHWASSIPAFLALACVPMPFLFYRYGATIRKKCHYAAESDALMEMMFGQAAAKEVKVQGKEPSPSSA
ncbi:hypothetical protein N7470_003802 [Penicillium chermesinum]|nr:hypothetical protein N7470_003802 [Penicillium chermesinum]